MKSTVLKFIVLTGILLGLPMLGVILAGYPISRYLEFPPETLYVCHAPFSRVAFTAYALFILAVVLPFIIKSVLWIRGIKPGPLITHTFPWWGWLGMITGIVSWVLAWTRFSWFAPYQPHTFTPLWLSFILVINALCYRRTGHCMMIDRTRFFLLLFPLSAAFWWFFEYLNRFVQNWSYTGVHYSSLAYFCHASLCFSTVLPAVLGTREWMAGAFRMGRKKADFRPARAPYPKILAGAVLFLSGASLAGMGVWPNYLFSLVWVSPLMVIVSLQVLAGKQTILSGMTSGNWRLIITSAAAALFCGGFWEMWNYYSLARWEYHIPFVHGFQIFEMPILGYAGYLPFGLECVVAGGFLERWMRLRGTI
jgi:hypothetical protein